MADLIKMVRHKEGFKAPYDADVHPDEINNYQRDGWVVVEKKQVAATEKSELAKKRAAAKKRATTKKRAAAKKQAEKITNAETAEKI